MNGTDRRIAAEVLHGPGVMLALIAHELYRTAHVYREGLTEKEYKYLMARHKAAVVEMGQLNKLNQRLKNHGPRA